MSEIKKSDSCCAGDGTHYENHTASLPAQTRPPAPAEKVKTRGIKCGDCGTPVSIKAFCPTCDSARAVTPNAVVEFIKQAQYICEKGEPRTCDIDLLRKLGKAAYPSGYEQLTAAEPVEQAPRPQDWDRIDAVTGTPTASSPVVRTQPTPTFPIQCSQCKALYMISIMPNFCPECGVDHTIPADPSCDCLGKKVWVITNGVKTCFKCHLPIWAVRNG